ncbi:Protein phosphatase 1 regulatory subunit, partial [Globisporangium splendens]
MSSSNVNEGGDASASAPKTARVVTGQQQAITPAAGVSVGAHDDEGEHEEAPPVVNKLTECVEFDRDAEDVYYVGTSGLKATEINGLEDMPKLEVRKKNAKAHGSIIRLHIRSNLLRSMDGIASLVQLEHLELYDNQIQKISCLDALVNLRVLDLSFNEIRVIPDLSHLTKLEELYVANNKLKKISGLTHLTTLKKLDLGANRLRDIEGLEGLENLEQLWLGKNKITKIQGLDFLKKLRIISVQSNRLEKVEGFENTLALEELYLSHNGITKLEGVAHLKNLTVMDVGANRITEIPEDIQSLTELEDLWLNDNQVERFSETNHLVPLKKLRTLYLERNPLAKDFEYRKRLEALLPDLDQIDATPTSKARRIR